MHVDLIDHMGSDLSVVNAARVSFHKESLEFTEQDEKLIKYLARHNHFTPFTHPQITLREKVPIFVARQRFKHTVGFSYNEVSRRYVDDEPEFYTPSVWRERAENIKQGSSNNQIVWLETGENVVWDDPNSPPLEISIDETYSYLLEHVRQVYQLLIKNDVAPEQARMVLPQSMYTEYYVTGSLSAFARAYKLRSDSHAQMEIQELAKLWDHIIRPLYPVSWSALVDA